MTLETHRAALARSLPLPRSTFRDVGPDPSEGRRATIFSRLARVSLAVIDPIQADDNSAGQVCAAGNGFTGAAAVCFITEHRHLVDRK